MRSIRTLLACTVAAIAALSLSACTQSDSAGNSLRPYLGRWVGTFVSTPTGSNQQETGTADITIASNGDVTGTMVNTTAGVTGTLSGDAGTGDAVVNVTGTVAYPGSNAYPIAGTLAIENNHLKGNVYTYDTQRHLLATATVDLARP